MTRAKTGKVRKRVSGSKGKSRVVESSGGGMIIHATWRVGGSRVAWGIAEAYERPVLYEPVLWPGQLVGQVGRDVYKAALDVAEGENSRDGTIRLMEAGKVLRHRVSGDEGVVVTDESEVAEALAAVNGYLGCAASAVGAVGAKLMGLGGIGVKVSGWGEMWLHRRLGQWLGSMARRGFGDKVLREWNPALFREVGDERVDGVLRKVEDLGQAHGNEMGSRLRLWVWYGMRCEQAERSGAKMWWCDELDEKVGKIGAWVEECCGVPPGRSVADCIAEPKGWFDHLGDREAWIPAVRLVYGVPERLLCRVREVLDRHGLEWLSARVV